jgi:uncharacterized protein YceH (UPF0502 family)
VFVRELGEALELDDAELSLLAALMLRGPQTVSELKQRSEQMHRFPSLEAVEQTLARLAEARCRRPAAATPWAE